MGMRGLARPMAMMLVFLATLAIAGCVSPEEQRAMDQRRCAGYGYQVGSDAFANCMMSTDQQRAAQNAADRRAADRDRAIADQERRNRDAASTPWNRPSGDSGARMISVSAGPIWNNSDAQNKCPRICSQNGNRRWDGNWRTTEVGRNSTCDCQR